MNKLVAVLFVNCIMLLTHESRAEPSFPSDQSLLISRLMSISTAKVYCATLQMYGLTTSQCSDSTNGHMLSIDGPTVSIHVVKQQSNSLALFVHKATGEKFYARAKVSPCIKIMYETNTLTMWHALLYGDSSARALFFSQRDISNLVAKVSAWKSKAELHNDEAIYTYTSEVSDNQACFGFRKGEISIQLAVGNKNAPRGMMMDLRVRPGESVEDAALAVSLREPGINIYDVSEKNLTKFMEIFCGLVARNLIPPKYSLPDLVAFLKAQK